MPSPTRGVPVTIDRERHFRYSLATLRKIEEELGGLDKIEGVGNITHVLWLGLKHEDEELTEEQLAELVDAEMLPDVIVAMRAAMGGGRLTATVGAGAPEATTQGASEGNAGAATAEG